MSEAAAVCPLCRRAVALDGGHFGGVRILVGHDVHPHLRARCWGSNLTLAEAHERERARLAWDTEPADA